jgi:RHS repeat-associated protein
VQLTGAPEALEAGDGPYPAPGLESEAALESASPQIAAPAAQSAAAPAPQPLSLTAAPPPSGPQQVVIYYTYDPVNRLTHAAYSDGRYFHYTYDAVGNRTGQETLLGSTVYDYDDANRLRTAGGVSYAWDNNGNLTSDGSKHYRYNAANRLIQISGTGVITTTWTYNALGDRSQETRSLLTTNYALDLNTGLTQVLAGDGQTYLYGLERLSQSSAQDTQYFLPDALGSVRQLVDQHGMITRVESYQPYGEEEVAYDNAETSYGFTGEWTSSYIKLQYLRSRWYSTEQGRFISRDNWQGNYNRPVSLNRWVYVEANPVNYVDPSGQCRAGDDECVSVAKQIVTEFPNIKINFGVPSFDCDGQWWSKHWTVQELVKVQLGLKAISEVLGNDKQKFTEMFGPVILTRQSTWLLDLGGDFTTYGKATDYLGSSSEVYITLFDPVFELDRVGDTVIHEFGHVLDIHAPTGFLSKGLLEATGGSCTGYNNLTGKCFIYHSKGITSPYGETDLPEDFAESFRGFILFSVSDAIRNGLGQIDFYLVDSERLDYIQQVLDLY